MTKELIKAIRESIAHWQRIRKWVKARIKAGKGGERKNISIMNRAIGEDWWGKSCALCVYFILDRQGYHCKDGCPLEEKYGSCCEINSAWKKVNSSFTWAEWYKASAIMLRQLKSLLPKKRKAFKGS